MEIAGLAVNIVSCLCAQACSEEKLARLNNLERPQVKVKRLTRIVDMLTARKEIINTKLDQAQVNEGKEPTPDVVLWLREVQEIKDWVGSTMNEIAVDKRCLNGCFPNYCSRVKRGKCIEEKIKEVDELLKRGNFSDDSLVDFPLEMGRRLPIPNILETMTTKRAIEDIQGYLVNDNVGRIGIYGMGGVGKTTIVTHINNLLIDEGTTRFDNIICVTVSKESNLEKLQKDIANKVKLDLSNEHGGMSRAAKLLQALERRKRLLLILDDMWKPFPIEAVGIPNPTKENGCKLVLTTRSLVVCRGMETHKNVQVNALSEEEAWDLFKDKVGDDVLLSSDIEATARNVARECDGLPLAIVTVGLALRNVYDASDWSNAFNVLRNSTGEIEGMEDRVFSRLRFSYDRLKDDKTRLCFLYCALYPEDHQIEIEELIEYWMGEGLLGYDGRRRETMQKGKIILNEIKDACMLQSVNQDGEGRYVKMHDLIRDMAIDITRMSPRCIIKAGIGLKKPPQRSEWKADVEKVSLMRNDVKELVNQPRCPKLSSLLLQYNSFQGNISDSFFIYMPNLKVVDLSYTGIEFLPESLCNLKNLRALLLCSCWNLRNLRALAELTALRVLDLSYTQITKLPQGMEMLVNLRRLNIAHTPLLNFRAGLLSKFTLLEDLLMHQCSFAWRSKPFWAIGGKACIEELMGSIHLAILQIHFLNMEAFQRYVISGYSDQLESFKFWVGNFRWQLDSHAGKNSVVICGHDLLGGPIPVRFPVHTLELYILRCVNISKLYEIFSNLMNLKKCDIAKCPDMEYFMVDLEDHLPSLERLVLHSLESLMGLCKEIHLPATLAKLKFLEVDDCPCLKSLFLRGQLQHLVNLEEIKVSNCIGMEVIIENEMSGTCNTTISISRLQKLELHGLMNLKSIYSGGMVCDSLHTIDVRNCERLKSIPLCLGDRQLATLKEIKGEKCWWDSLEWAHPTVKILLQPFFKPGVD